MIKCTMILLSSLVILSNIYFASSFKQDDIRNYLGTRTPYRWKYNKNDTEIKYPGCQGSKIWMMVRHGSRLPNAADIEGMNTTLKDLKYEILLGHKAGRGELSNEQLEHLEKWYSDLDKKEEKYLTAEGGDEMTLLARRMQKRFPSILTQQYDNKTFLFRFTATQRAEESAKHFSLGLFDKGQALKVAYSPPSKVDPVLRFYKHCEKWRRQVKRNETTYEEQKLFGISQLMNNSIDDVSIRLGLDRNLTLDELVLMYKICGYESSWNKHQISPWCYGLDAKSGKNLEYYHDLRHYWLDGYGHELTYRHACLAVKNMFDYLRKPGPPNATFLFAHSGTILKILSHIQLYRPTRHLRANHMDDARPWRASDIDCFASNLAFVLFKCDDGAHVLTMHQERVIKLPMCKHELCPLEHLLDYFYESIYKCDYSDMCRLDKTEL